MDAVVDLGRFWPRPARMAHGRASLFLLCPIMGFAISLLCARIGVLFPVRLELLSMQGLILGPNLGKFPFKFPNAIESPVVP